MSILLGKYNKHKSFYMYKIHHQEFMCLEDLNFIYFNQQLATKYKELKRLVQLYPNDFKKHKQTQEIFVKKPSVLLVSNLFQSYSLNELFKLTTHDILSGVAEPILKCNRLLTTVQPRLVIDIVQPDQFEALEGNEWIFEPTMVTLPPVIHIKSHPLDSSITSSSLYPWFSLQNLYEHESLTPEMIQTLFSMAKIKAQQKAIIETRQLKSSSAGNYSSNSRKRKKSCAYMDFNKKIKTHSNYNNNLDLLATQATHQLKSQTNTSFRLPSIRSILNDM